MCKCELFLMALHLWHNAFLIALMDLADTCIAFTAHTHVIRNRTHDLDVALVL